VQCSTLDCILEQRKDATGENCWNPNNVFNYKQGTNINFLIWTSVILLCKMWTCGETSKRAYRDFVHYFWNFLINIKLFSIEQFILNTRFKKNSLIHVNETSQVSILLFCTSHFFSCVYFWEQINAWVLVMLQSILSINLYVDSRIKE
jgi:hypothetical protein